MSLATISMQITANIFVAQSDKQRLQIVEHLIQTTNNKATTWNKYICITDICNLTLRAYNFLIKRLLPETTAYLPFYKF
jgi:hypothetical protein